MVSKRMMVFTLGAGLRNSSFSNILKWIKNVMLKCVQAEASLKLREMVLVDDKKKIGS